MSYLRCLRSFPHSGVQQNCVFVLLVFVLCTQIKAVVTHIIAHVSGG